MDPENKPCHWWTDPADGRRYFIPGCMGAAVYGKKGCTCPPVAKRRQVMRHHDPLADYAHVVRQWAEAKEKIRAQALELRELKRQVRELIDDDIPGVLQCVMANRESIDARRCQGFEDAQEHGPGAFFWMVEDDRRTMVFHLPGEEGPRAIQVRPGQGDGNGIWGWDGNEDAPTLQPSILAWDRNQGERVEVWHGYLTAGRFVSC